MKIAIIDYKAGNIKSVEAALQRLGCETILTKDPQTISAADKVIFPGVGHANAALEALKAAGLDTLIPSLTQPVLGICLGMQMMCQRSEEGDTPCLGIFDTEVVKFRPEHGEKIPHMGWNQISQLKSPLFEGIPDGSFMYFVHSYMVPVFEHTAAKCGYARDFSAAIARDNFYGCQFHPEKSGNIGLKILENFIKL
ncbi:MAG: imidazole glycerol phosphate synthase subunit HisH [Bacteroidales bacterium]|nr:imidazole glycerol phosphate synthase subunit HisH [Bacteroidales bacterium]